MSFKKVAHCQNAEYSITKYLIRGANLMVDGNIVLVMLSKSMSPNLIGQMDRMEGLLFSSDSMIYRAETFSFGMLSFSIFIGKTRTTDHTYKKSGPRTATFTGRRSGGSLDNPG